MTPITLYPSRKKWIGVTLIGLAFVAIGIFMIMDDQGWIAWVCTAFFLLMAAVGVAQLFPGTSYMTLNEEGFEYKTLGRSARHSWAEVHGFTSWRTAGNNFVGFETGGSGKLADVNRNIAGADQSLPDTYGMKPDALIDLMVQYSEAYWAKHPQSDIDS